MSTALRKLDLVSYHLGRRIRIEDAARTMVDRVLEKAKSDLSLRLGEGWVFLFSFGSAVFVGIEPASKDIFLQEIGPHVEGPTDRITDDLHLVVDPTAKDKIFFEEVVLQELTVQKLDTTTSVQQVLMLAV